jgi:O-antigen/teichoic acid export membrane protein
MTAINRDEAGIELATADTLFASSVDRLARAAAGSFGLSVVQMLITTLTTIVLARVMGVADYGTYAFVIATVTLLGVPAVLGVDRLLIRDLAVYVGDRSYGLARGILSRTTQQTLVISVAISATAAVAFYLIADGNVTPDLVAMWAGLVALPFLALGRVAQGGLMGLHRVVMGQFSDLLLRPFMLLASVVFVLALFGPPLPAPVVVSLYAVTMALACVVAYVLLFSRRPAEMRSEQAQYRGREWLGASLGLALLSSTAIINTQTGVVLLGAIGTPEATGLYSVAQRGALLVAFPLAAVNAAMGPTAARLWASKDRARLQHLVTVSARAVLLGSLPIAIAFVLFGREIISLLFGAEFAAAEAPLAILCIGQLANAATGSVGVLLVMTGYQHRATAAMAAGAVLNVVLGLVLIPVYAEVGAAIAATVSLIVSNVVMTLATRRKLGIDSTAAGFPPRRALA